MSVLEILDVLQARTGTQWTGSELISVTRRLYDIAWFNHQVSMEDRTKALALLEGANADIEKILCEAPELLGNFREATSITTHRAKLFGFGSLPWLMEEHHVPDDEVIAFMMRPEYAHLLANAIEAIGPEAVAEGRPEMVRELIRTRSPGLRTRNSVLILHGLACARDPACEALFSQPEIQAIRQTHRDYVTARNVLVSLGVLPAQADTPLFDYPSSAILGQIVFIMLAEVLGGPSCDAATMAHLQFPDDDWRQGLSVGRLLLGVHLALSHVRASEGVDSCDALRAYLLQRLPNAQEAGFNMLLEQVDNMEEVAFKEDSLNPDMVILYTLVTLGKPQWTEGEFNEKKAQLVEGGKLLTLYRVTFLDRLRVTLRHITALAPGSLTSELPSEALREVMAKSFGECDDDCLPKG